MRTPPRDASSRRSQANPDPAPIQDPRDAANRHLSAHAKRFPDLLPSEINTGVLDPRDAALAHAIVDASMRRWRTLEHILEQISGHRSFELEPRMRAVLLSGAAQLLLLDRVPPHAVLDESVGWAKRHIRPGAGGMVNAVLRKVARVRGEKREESWEHHIDAIPLSEGGILLLNDVELPQDGRKRLGIACSLPDALLIRWESLEGDPTQMALHTLFRAPTSVCTQYSVNPVEHDDLHDHESSGHKVFMGSRQTLIGLIDSHPDIWVQDPASTATLGRLELETVPERVIDLCAGQGTKSRQLRAMFPDSELVVSDIDPKRLSTLRELFRDDPATRVMHAGEIGDRLPGWANLVLADVPCSNTGVLARRVEARYRPIEPQLKRLIETQRSILRTAHGLLSPGGMLVYATCSVEEEENEEQTLWASTVLGLQPVTEHRVDPQGLPGDPPAKYRDGAFAACLRL